MGGRPSTPTSARGSRLVSTRPPVRLGDLLRDVGPPEPPIRPPRGSGEPGPKRFGTFRLRSEGVHAPGTVRVYRDLWTSDPELALESVEDTWEIHPEPAQALASAAVDYRVEGDVVVFDYHGGIEPRPRLWRHLRNVAAPLVSELLLDEDVVDEAMVESLARQAERLLAAIRDVGRSRRVDADTIADLGRKLLDDLERRVFLVYENAVVPDPESDEYVRFFEAESSARALLARRR